MRPGARRSRDLPELPALSEARRPLRERQRNIPTHSILDVITTSQTMQQFVRGWWSLGNNFCSVVTSCILSVWQGPGRERRRYAGVFTSILI